MWNSSPPRPRWYAPLVHQLYGMFLALWMCAFPRLAGDRHAGVHVRGDRHTGSAMGSVYSVRPAPLRELCARSCSELVAMSLGVHVVAWIDNFKLKYTPDPQEHTHNLDMTAVAFLHVPHFCRFGGHVNLSHILIQMGPNTQMLSKASDDLMQHIKDQLLHVPSRKDLRIPLDIHRYSGRLLP